MWKSICDDIGGIDTYASAHQFSRALLYFGIGQVTPYAVQSCVRVHLYIFDRTAYEVSV